MKKTILLLIDSYSNDLQLIDYAVALAKSQQAFLELFDARWIAHAPPFKIVPSSIINEMNPSTEPFQHSKNEMEKLCQMVKKKYPLTDYHLSKSLMIGDFPDKTNFWMDEVKSIQPIAVVMRVHHEMNRWNEMFGTEETKVAEQANCPVLLIPKKLGNFLPFKNIGYFLDREKPLEEAIEEIQFLSNIVKFYQGGLSIYYLSEESEETAKLELAVMRSQLSNAIDFEKFRIQDFSPSYTPKLVNNLVKIKINSLVAFPKREKNFLQRWSDTDNTKRLILGANIPVLVF